MIEPSAQFLALTSRPDAQLPALYEQARHKLQRASRVDECKKWADKTLALASYARQAKDDELLILANRIRCRAIRRCGELLHKLNLGKPGPKIVFSAEGFKELSPRRQAAIDAGMSEYQRRLAERVANIPTKIFEDLVEKRAPSINSLMELGASVMAEDMELEPEPEPEPPPDPMLWLPEHLQAIFDNLTGLAEAFNMETVAAHAKGFPAHRQGEILALTATVILWLEEFSSYLECDDG